MFPLYDTVHAPRNASNVMGDSLPLQSALLLLRLRARLRSRDGHAPGRRAAPRRHGEPDRRRDERDGAAARACQRVARGLAVAAVAGDVGRRGVLQRAGAADGGAV